MKKIFLAILSVMLGTYTFSVKASMDDERPPLYDERSALFRSQGTDSESIVMLGNSLIQGGEWNTLLNNEHAVNQGIIGDTAFGILERLDAATDGKPAKIFLICGANDVSHDLSATEIAFRIMRVVNEIRKRTPQTRVYVMSVLPINNSFGRYKRMIGKEQTIRDLNVLLEPMATAAGAIWINIHPHFTDEDGNLRENLTSDGLHLLPPGYEIWRNIILPYVSE